MRFSLLPLLAMLSFGCSSTHNLAMMARGTVSAERLLADAQGFTELGPVEGQACRYFVLAIVPFGDSTPTAAMEKALVDVGGDALLNASVTTSLYGFVPIYNVLSFTCTTVRGSAIRFDR
jgi:hypothetical protein